MAPIVRHSMVMNASSDQVDIRLVLQGQAHAYASIVNRHKDMVYSLCFQILHQREEAEEAAMDVFLKVYQTLSSFRGQSKFSTWIYRIAVNTAISRTRKRKLQWIQLDENRHEDITLPHDQALDEVLSAEERIEITREAVEQLPEGDRLLVMLYYHDEQSMEEISSITGLSISNVKVRLHRLRKRLLTELNERIFVTL